MTQVVKNLGVVGNIIIKVADGFTTIGKPIARGLGRGAIWCCCMVTLAFLLAERNSVPGLNGCSCERISGNGGLQRMFADTLSRGRGMFASSCISKRSALLLPINDQYHS